MVFLLSEYKVTDVILSDNTKINCLDLVKLVVVCAYPETVMTLPAYSRVNTWAASRTFKYTLQAAIHSSPTGRFADMPQLTCKRLSVSFLQCFVGKTPRMHLKIRPAYDSNKHKYHISCSIDLKVRFYLNLGFIAVHLWCNLFMTTQ